MKILFLGGTRFVGRHMVEAALARGHAVTLFHRGSPDAPVQFIDARDLAAFVIRVAETPSRR